MGILMKNRTIAMTAKVERKSPTGTPIARRSAKRNSVMGSNIRDDLFGAVFFFNFVVSKR
jgi:hypothetical protein